MSTFVVSVIFGVCVGGVIYNYVGYPILLFCLSILSQAKSDLLLLIRGQRDRRCVAQNTYLPTVAVIISAYNEEEIINAKIHNTFLCEYPAAKLEVLIGLDASTDSTAARLKDIEYPNCRIIHFSVRRGKLAVIRDLAQRTAAEIVVLTDANTMFEPTCIRHLTRHFANPHVGAVSGQHVWVAASGAKQSSEALYWRYESGLRFLESRVNCLLAAYGSIYAVRRSLFYATRDSIIEDFQIPLEIRLRGYRVVYDPEAIATESMPPTFAAQFERRVRLAAGAYQTFVNNPQCLNPSFGLLAWSYLSHRVLRWLTPGLLVTAFVCNVCLVGRPLFQFLFISQLLFYFMALLGYWRKKKGKSMVLFWMPLGFCYMNLALLLGCYRYVCGRQSSAWQVAPRRV